MTPFDRQPDQELLDLLFGDPFKKPSSGFELDKDRRVKVNPLTGEKIAKKDRRAFKRIRRNPSFLTAGNAISADIPSIPNLLGGMGGFGSGGPSSISSILGF